MPEPRPSPVIHLGAWAAFAVPLAVAVGRLTGEGHWSDDLPVVRALSLMQVGAEGLVSSALASVWALLPVGDRLFRLGLLSATLVGCAGVLTFRLCLGLLNKGVTPWARSVVALAAAWTASLGPLWQWSGTGVGRGIFAECLLLVSLVLVRRARGPGVWAAHAVICGLLFAERRGLVPMAVGVAVVGAVVGRGLPTGRDLWRALWVLGLTLGLVFLPSLLEMLGPPSGMRLGFDLDLPVTAPAVVATLREEVGWYGALLVLVAVGSSALRGQLRPLAAPLFLIGCAAWPAHGGGTPAAVSAAAALGGLGFLAFATWLAEAKVSFARSALGLCGLLHLCSVVLLAEDARRGAERQQVNGTRAWSREAFGRLPPRALLLVRSPDAVWRLWASQLTEGTRPDVMIVPAPLLTHGTMARQLLELEPRLKRMIRDLAVTGAASEYALSEVADARALRVELDQEWPPAVLSHLASDGLWFRLAPESLGRTDRAFGLRSLEAARDRVLSASRTRQGRDDATLARVFDDLFAHAVLTAALGESTSANQILSDLKRLEPADTRWLALARKLEETPRGFASLGEFALRK